MTTKPFVACLKILFYIFNFVFWLSGLALLVTGILVKTAFASFMKLSTHIDYNVAPYVMIGCGAFIVLVGFCGCWASVKEHPWALRFYMAVLTILFIAEVAGAIAGLIMKKKLQEGLKEGLENALKEYKTDKGIADAMDKIQHKGFGCCGATSYENWFKHGFNNTVPKSCCKPDVKCLSDDLPDDVTTAGIYTTGCYDKMLDVAAKNFKIVGGVALGIAVFQLMGIACGYFLTKAFSDNNKYETM